MTLTIELPPDVEAKFTSEARSLGITVEQRVMDKLTEMTQQRRFPTESARPLKLPTMKGTVIGSLHRRDIYEEPR